MSSMKRKHTETNLDSNLQAKMAKRAEIIDFDEAFGLLEDPQEQQQSKQQSYKEVNLIENIKIIVPVLFEN
jgi:hypothetical protein